MTSPPLIVDASLAVRSAMVPYRAGDRGDRRGRGRTPGDGGSGRRGVPGRRTASATSVSNLQEVSDGIARYWSGQASRSYQKANAALGQRVIVAQRRLDRQSQAARELDPTQPSVYNEHHWG